MAPTPGRPPSSTAATAVGRVDEPAARADAPRRAGSGPRRTSTHPEGGRRPATRSPDAGADAGAPWWDPATDASVDPWTDTVEVDGVELRKGSPVRLRPSGRADAQDMFLDGRRATVAGVFADVDGEQHVAVTLDDDPASGRAGVAGPLPLLPPRRGGAAARDSTEARR